METNNIKNSPEKEILLRLDTLEKKVAELQDIIESQFSLLRKISPLSAEDTLNLVLFNVDSLRCCFFLHHIKEIVRIVAITPLPDTPEIMEGVIDYRGEVIPIIDIRHKFGLETSEYDLEYHLLIFDIEGLKAGIVVDQVLGVKEIRADAIESPMNAPFKKSFVTGIVKHEAQIVMIINPVLLLSLEEKQGVTQAVQSL
ncbi:chemotaxis protein CheW [candidate division CSSED10-310 bacterium]|uniref:Chemotaxis protein CheW n=1 Tax=candidate division CSSED10-310 bacterium TaxID=2855610 RepID=A0ABV6YTI5_UNCC1